jgi:hypothetical protein
MPVRIPALSHHLQVSGSCNGALEDFAMQICQDNFNQWQMLKKDLMSYFMTANWMVMPFAKSWHVVLDGFVLHLHMELSGQAGQETKTQTWKVAESRAESGDC